MAIQSITPGEKGWATKANSNDTSLSNDVETLKKRMVSNSDWITTGVTMTNGFNTASDGNALAWRQIKYTTGESQYFIAGQLNIPSGGVQGGTSVQIGTIPQNIVPDRGTFLGEVYLLASGSINVSVGNITLGSSSGKLTVTMKSQTGVTMDKAPNGWLSVYLSFFANPV